MLDRVLARHDPGYPRSGSPMIALPMVVLSAALLLSGGCALHPLAVDGSSAALSITPRMLLEGQPLTGGIEPAPLPATDILGLDDDMRRFVAGHVPDGGPDQWRLRLLLKALLRNANERIEYDDHTYTAAEAFHLRRANCLGYTNLFVALARDAGLAVHFQEVDVPPDWSRSAAGFVQSRHVNTLVTAGDGSERVVDFNLPDFRASYPRRVISDARAAAHFYSNIGVERMEAGNTTGALLNFRKAIALDDTFDAAWINLGALYSRNGHREHAEAAWRHVLELEPRAYIAMSNLERLYRHTGRLAAADRLADRIERFRNANPYWRFHLAGNAFGRGDYPGAIGHLKAAIREKPDDDRFYALMALAYERQGDTAKAREWMARAESVAADGQLKDHYHGKLERLKSAALGLDEAGTAGG